MKNEIKVFCTKDYSKFNKLKGNRELKSVNKIIKSVMEVGYIPNPLLCNEKLEVIDGQNRLEAFKRLGLPIYYYCMEGLSLKEAQSLNMGQSNWNTENFVCSYASEGKQSYVFLLALFEEFKPISFIEIAAISKNEVTKNGFGSSAIKNGSFEMSKAEYLVTQSKLRVLHELLEQIDEINCERRLALTGLAFCLGLKGTDSKRLIGIVKDKPTSIGSAYTPNEFLRNVQTVYNMNLKKDKKMYFEHEYDVM